MRERYYVLNVGDISNPLDFRQADCLLFTGVEFHADAYAEPFAPQIVGGLCPSAAPFGIRIRLAFPEVLQNAINECLCLSKGVVARQPLCRPVHRAISRSMEPSEHGSI